MRIPEQLWWLSFASDDGFLGACIVEAPGFLSAISVAHSKGVNPGGEVRGWFMQEHTFESVAKLGFEPYRLYSKDDIAARGGVMRLGS